MKVAVRFTLDVDVDGFNAAYSDDSPADECRRQVKQMALDGVLYAFDNTDGAVRVVGVNDDDPR